MHGWATSEVIRRGESFLGRDFCSTDFFKSSYVPIGVTLEYYTVALDYGHVFFLYTHPTACSLLIPPNVLTFFPP